MEKNSKISIPWPLADLAERINDVKIEIKRVQELAAIARQEERRAAKKEFMDYLNSRYSSTELLESGKHDHLIQSPYDEKLASEGKYGELLKKNSYWTYLYWWCDSYY
jgi:hypothetical protein